MGNNAKEKLYRFVEQLRGSLGVTPLGGPISAIELCRRQAEIEYHSFTTPGFCGAAFIGSVSDTVILNSARTPYEQNFDCGHEIIHLTKHRNQNGGIFKCFSRGQDDYLEWEANEGAAQLLVPYQDFIPRFLCCLRFHTVFQNNSSGGFNPNSIQESLASYYQVSPQVINIRLSSLSYEIDQYRRGVPLESIELLSRNQREKRGIRCTCYSAVCAFPCISAI